MISIRSGSRDQPQEAHHRTKLSWPAWLDARTITLLSAILGLAALMQAAQFRLSGDIAQLRQDVRADMAELRHELKGDIAELRDELKAEISGVRDELKAEISEVRDELKTDIHRLDDRLRTVEVDVAAIRTSLAGLDDRLNRRRRCAPRCGPRAGGTPAGRRGRA